MTGLLTSPGVMAQTTVTLKGARGTTPYSLAQSTTGGIIINQVFGADYPVVGGGGGGGGGAGGLLEGNTKCANTNLLHCSWKR